MNYQFNTADALELIAECIAATDEKSIMTILSSLCQEMGFDHFLLFFISPSSIRDPDVCIFNGCPDEWVKVYNGRNFFPVDPIVRKAMAQTTPIILANIINECCDQQDVDGLEVILSAYEAGLQDSITIPWHGPNDYAGMLSLILCKQVGEHKLIGAIPFIRWLVDYIFEAILRVYLSTMQHHESLSKC